jgi:hypothetical protein
VLRKKLSLGRAARTIIFALLGLLLAGSFYYLFSVFREPSVVTKELPAYSFRHHGNLDYKVQIKPNSVFAVQTMGPGESYYTNLVQSIDARCSYSYTAEQAADLSAVYSVVAVVKNPDVWTKEFILVPPATVQAEGREISFVRDFSFNLDDFEAFLDEANTQLGVFAENPEVAVEARVKVTAETADGRSGAELTPSMVIPLGVSKFEIGGKLSPEKSGSLNKPTQVPNPGLSGRKIRAISFTGALLLLGIAFTLFTVSKEPVSAGVVDLFWKKYGERMVKAGADFTVPEDLILIPLHSVEDLTRVADEAGKPIIYQEAGLARGVPACYVIDGLTAYMYAVAETDSRICTDELGLQAPGAE